jgi:hypothetical protein
VPKPQRSALRKSVCYLVAATVVIGLGLALRLLPLGLPHAVFKYGGSALWGAMVYLIVAACLPRFSTVPIAGLASVAAILTELSQLYHAPALDAFRRTRIGVLLLGRYFSLGDIAAYLCGIALAAGIDRIIRLARVQAPA